MEQQLEEMRTELETYAQKEAEASDTDSGSSDDTGDEPKDADEETENVIQAQRDQLQLAILKLGRGDHVDAGRLASEIVDETSRQRHRKPIALRAHATMAACAGSASEWVAAREHLSAAAVLASETGVVERKVAWCLARAGELARRDGPFDLALHAWELALEQYRGLGDEGQVRRLKTLIQRES